MEFRPYQVEDTARIRAAFREHRRVLYVLPTGGGKTEMFVDMAIRHARKNPNALVYILVHRIELMDQVVGTVHANGARCGLLSPTVLPGEKDRIVVASVQTLVRRIQRVATPTFLITDEAHHATGRTSWGKVSAAYGTIPQLGVTATPCRLSGEGLADCFDTLVAGPSAAELIRLGYLARPRVYCPAVPELQGVHLRGGEYISSELEKILDRSTITGDAIHAYRNLANGKRFVAFGVSRAHIEKVAKHFNDSGINVRSVDGTLAEKERKDIIDAFRIGRITGLVSCQLIDEGFNVPGIECGIDLAPTKSLSRYLQRIGRCLRVADGKTEAVVLDLAGNALRHGLPDAPQCWSLSGIDKPLSRANLERPRSVRICDQCLGASRSTSDACGLCGYVFPVNGRTFIAQKGELQLLREAKASEIEAQRKRREEERAIQKTTFGYKSLVLLAQRRGYRNPEQWAHIIHDARLAKKKQMRVRL